MNQSTNLVNAFLKSCLLFLITLWLAWYLKWDIVDVSWSIWVATFAVSIISVFAGAVFFYWFLEYEGVTEQKVNPHYNPSTTQSNIAFVLFVSGLLFCLVYIANLLVAQALDGLLPLFNAGNDMKMLQFPLYAFTTYWPFLLISLINPCLFYYQIFKQNKYQEDEEIQVDLLFKPYHFVFRNQALAILLMLLAYLSNEYLVYWILLLLYFFPWSEFWSVLKVKYFQKQDV